MDHLAIDGKRAIASMMQRGRVLPNRIDPSFDDLEDEKVVPIDEARFAHPAFEIGEAVR